MSRSAPSPGRPPGRLLALDAFRGATMIAMILVNNPGTWSAVYPPLLHAPWHGWTPTDLVFPFFLFIVGVAVPLALGPRLEAGATPVALFPLIARRATILFLLGLLLAAYPFLQLEPGFGLRPGAFERLRFMGVLQRIALCYAGAATAFLLLGPRARRALVVTLLLGSWAVLALVPVPGFGAGDLDHPEANFGAWLDRALLGEDHLWAGADRRWDPEGLFGTLAALATTLIGVAAGSLLRESRPSTEQVAALLVRGVLLLALGAAWAPLLPINKSLWTSSYAVLTAGCALCALGLAVWFAEVRGRRAWAWPLAVYGLNPLTVFVGSGLLAKTLILIRVPTADGGVPLQAWLFDHLFRPLAPPRAASLLYAVAWVVAWGFLLRLMERRGWVLKV
jgi:predicted acyltransferase